MAGTTVSKRLSNKIQENRALIDQAKLDRDKILELGDKISAQANHIGEIELELKEWNRKQREGYCWMIKDKDNIVLDMGEVPGYSMFTFVQEIPREISTAKYRSLPFYMEEKGQIKIHTKKYMTYNSM
jgi:hypothetical protein